MEYAPGFFWLKMLKWSLLHLLLRPSCFFLPVYVNSVDLGSIHRVAMLTVPTLFADYR
jgi:hypothetical protein